VAIQVKTAVGFFFYNENLFFIWITTPLDSAYGMNRSARDDEKPYFNINL
jgi:hypothetical protein